MTLTHSARNAGALADAGANPLPLRTCCRCGQEFRSPGKYICRNCFSPRQVEAPALGQPLTPREKQIVALITEGKCNKDVAAALHLTPETTSMYASKIFRKMGVHSRLELAVQVLKQTA